MRFVTLAVILANLLAVSMGLPAITLAQEDVTTKREAAAIRAAAKDYAAALARGDAGALSKLWTDDGDYVDATGQRFKAREIISQLSGSIEKKRAVTSDEESKLRFITADVVVEDGTMGAEVTDDGEAAAGRFTAVWVKRDGRWRLDSLREAINVPVAEDPLQALEWLIGEWAGKADGSSVLVSSHRSNDGHFVVREFVDRHADGSAISGTQRIGWDASAGKLKCWTFDSLGGSGEGTWKRDGNRWVVESTDVLPDGRILTGRSTYIPGADGQFVWESAGAAIGDTSVPARRVKFNRAAEK